MNREDLLKYLEQFGEVIAMCFEVRSKGSRHLYSGIGYVQYRHPSSLVKAWSYEHCKQCWGGQRSDP
eukprot:4626656-Karenia_brevis.AAC.1